MQPAGALGYTENKYVQGHSSQVRLRDTWIVGASVTMLGSVQGSPWLYAQGSPLAGFRWPYGVQEIKRGSTACKASALPAVL